MGFSLLADWAGKCIFEIDPAALERRGIRLLLADLDNTLVPYGVPEPTEEVRAWAAALAGRGVELFVLSNNRRPQRPERFSKALGVPFLGHAGKPKVRSFAAAMERMLPLPKIWLPLPSIIAISLILALLPQISAP